MILTADLQSNPPAREHQRDTLHVLFSFFFSFRGSVQQDLLNNGAANVITVITNGSNAYTLDAVIHGTRKTINTSR
jgi:hypothetical protein